MLDAEENGTFVYIPHDQTELADSGDYITQEGVQPCIEQVVQDNIRHSDSYLVKDGDFEVRFVYNGLWNAWVIGCYNTL